MKNFLKIFYSFTDREKRDIYINTSLMFFVSILEAFSIGLIFPISQLIFNDDKVFLKLLFFDNKNENILFLIFLFIFIIILKNIFFSFVYYRISIFSENIRNNLARFIFNKYIFTDYLEYLKLKPGETIRNLSSYPSIYQQYIFTGISLIQEIFIVFLITTILLVTSFNATILGLISILFIVIFSKFIFKKRLKNIGMTLAENTAKYSKYIHFSMSCIKDIKLFQSENEFEKRFNNFFEKYSKASALNQFLSSLPRFLAEIYLTIIMGILFLYIHLSGLNIENYLSTMSVFAVAALRLLPSGSKIIINNNTISFLNPMISDILDLFKKQNNDKIKTVVEDIITKNLKDTYDEKNYFEVKDLNFHFLNGKNKIETKLINLSFKIQKNSIFGIIGKSGSGKSTLLNIICGLINPISGAILYKNQDIRNLKDSWKKKIGYVPQEVKIFDDTLLNNITMYNREFLKNDKINIYLDILNLKEFVDTLPEGLQTILGSEGIELSVGQKQRIGLLRAIIRDPEILILDETTSSLDKKTEDLILSFINKIKKNKTIIFISHDQNLSNIYDEKINLDYQ
jgi:ATP-binding cassette, subfamily B, bacterial PglK